MKVSLPDKWVETGAADDRLVDLAARGLRSRLGAVRELLPVAAEQAERDIEAIHQLRVWTRRASAALGLYEDLIPRRRHAWMKKQLKRIRHAANDARDRDVLIERLRKRPKPGGVVTRWLEETRAERKVAQEAVVHIHRRLKRDRRFARRIDALLKRVDSRAENREAATASIEDCSRNRLRPLVDRFFAAVPTDRTDEAGLHRFRVKGKELRYAMELLAGAFPETFRTRLYATIQSMQDRLGDINDLATSKAMLRRKMDDAAAGDSPSWQLLLADEEARSVRARREFRDWCTPRRLRELRLGFEAVLAQPTENRAEPERPPSPKPAPSRRATARGNGPAG